MISSNNIKEVLMEAGELCLELQGTAQSKTADVAVNELLKRQLLQLTPSAAWLSEESPDIDARIGSDLVWIVDPLDGTKEYLKGSSEYSVSVALLDRDGVAHFSGVYAPRSQFGAIATRTEFLSWGHTPAKSATTSSDLRVSVSRSEFNKGNFEFLHNQIEITPIGSVALKLMRISLGLENAYISFEPKSEWDICGGAGLIQFKELKLERLDCAALRFNQANTRIESGLLAGDEKTIQFLRSLLPRKFH